MFFNRFESADAKRQSASAPVQPTVATPPETDNTDSTIWRSRGNLPIAARADSTSGNDELGPDPPIIQREGEPIDGH